MVSERSSNGVEDNGTNSERSYEEFKPTLGLSIVWTILATVMTVGGFILFTVMFAILGNGAPDGSVLVETGSENDAVYFSFRFGNMLVIMALALGVLFVHEAIHGAAFWYYGGRPTFGATIIQKILPAFYCSAPGYWFTRGQFAVIILAPLVVITVVGLVLMPFVDDGLLLVFPLAINFGGAVGDLWMAGMLIRRKPGTMIEDLRDGLRFFPPDPTSDRSNAAN